MSETIDDNTIHEKINEKYVEMKEDIKERQEEVMKKTPQKNEVKEKSQEQIQKEKADEQNRMVVEQITRLIQNLNDKNATEIAKIIVSLLIRVQICEGGIKSLSKGLDRHDKALKVMFLDLEKLQKKKKR